MSANTRRALSLNDRQDILRKYDQLPKMGQRDTAVRLNISQSDDTVERALKEWFVKVRNKDARVSGPLLRQKAEELAEKMGKVDFKATEGWFHRWKKRENICFQKMHGEQGDADFTGAHFWLENEWPSLISEFSPSDVFNADETGLYFRALPEHTYVLQNDKAKGTKSCKERITILCCASMTGEKKKLLVVGKSKQPRCFKGVKALPVDYTAKKNAWMTQEIFSQWLIKWDNELDRKIVLLIDNCTAHNPCDQGIIRTLKAYYRLKMRKRVITLIDEMFECESTSTLKANDLSKKINILEALHFVNEAWNNISDVTIRNCFRHGGFVKTEEEEEEEDDHRNIGETRTRLHGATTAGSLEKKLKASSSPSQQEEVSMEEANARFIKHLQQVYNLSKGLDEEVTAAPNTKREIKALITQLSSGVRGLIQWGRRKGRVSVSTSSRGIQTDPDTTKMNAEKRTTEVQTSPHKENVVGVMPASEDTVHSPDRSRFELSRDFARW
ncbi:hypothetical protein QTP88_010049 [Uroleucon formosanum]